MLLAAGITRFGVLAVVIFLVQILIGLYRYNAKVVSLYLSQADALLLLGHSSKDIGGLLKEMSSRVDFGKTADTLPEKIIDRLAQALTTGASRAAAKVKGADGSV